MTNTKMGYRMKWRAGGVVFIGLALALGLAFRVYGSSQPPKAADRAATEAYLPSRYTLEDERVARLPVDARTVGRLVASIASECPGVMTGAPRDEDFEMLALERLVILSLVLLPSQVGSSTAYAHVVSRIQWSNRRLTRLVRSWLSEEVADAHLVSPDPCVGMRAWVRSGYHRLPASTTEFLVRSEAIGGRTRVEKSKLHVPPARTGKVVLKLLERYESSMDRVIALRLKHMEAKLFGSDVAIVASAALRLAHALGAS